MVSPDYSCFCKLSVTVDVWRRVESNASCLTWNFFFPPARLQTDNLVEFRRIDSSSGKNKQLDKHTRKQKEALQHWKSGSQCEWCVSPEQPFLFRVKRGVSSLLSSLSLYFPFLSFSASFSLFVYWFARRSGALQHARPTLSPAPLNHPDAE